MSRLYSKNGTIYARLMWDTVSNSKKVSFGKEWGKLPREEANTAARLTGKDFDLVAIDLDSKTLDDIKNKKLRKWLAKHPPNVETARGFHWYFHYPDGATIKNGTHKFGGKVDVRGDGGLVFCEYWGDDDRIHYQAKHDKRYKMPDWMIDLFASSTSKKKPEGAVALTGAPSEEEIEEALDRLGASYYEDHDKWLSVMMALKHWGGIVGDDEKAWELFDRWSAQSPDKYDQKSNLKRWNSLEPDGGIGYRTLFHFVHHEAGTFDPYWFPEDLRDYMSFVAESLNVPFGATVPFVLSMLGALLGGKTEVSIYRNGEFVVQPIIWSMLVGGPSTMKSQVLRKLQKPLNDLEKKAFENYGKKLGKWKRENTWLDHLIKQAKKNGDDDEVKKLEAKRTDPPTNPTISLTDVTPEALARKANELDGKAIFMAYDEGGYLLDMSQKAGREGLRRLLMIGYDGGRHTEERMSRGNVTIERLLVGVHLNVQPPVIAGVIDEAKRFSGGADGFLARFQAIVRLDPIQEADEPDLLPSDEYERFASVVKRFYRGKKILDRYHLTNEGRAVFVEEMKRIRKLINDSIMGEYLGKHYAFIAAVALIFHVVESPKEKKIGTDTLRRATFVAEALRHHARELYVERERREEAAIQMQSERILHGIEKLKSYVEEHGDKFPMPLRELQTLIRVSKKSLGKRTFSVDEMTEIIQSVDGVKLDGKQVKLTKRK